MTLKIGFATAAPAKADTVAATIWQSGKLGKSAAKLDKELKGLLSHHLKNKKSFTGKAGQVMAVSAPTGKPYTRVVLFGMGEAKALDEKTCESAGGKLQAALAASGASHAVIHADLDDENMVAHFALGMKLRSYKFDKYKTKKKDDGENAAGLETATIVATAKAKKSWAALEGLAEGVFLARDLVSEPPNILYPGSYAEIVKKELPPLGVDVEIFDEKKMEKLGFRMHLAVGMGSARKPRVVVMRWNGASSGKKKKEPLAFVGKGVTFDTGGINIKPSAGMEDMKYDMAGSAAVVGLMKSLALRKAKIDVVGIIGLAENMPSDAAYRPSDILKSLDGKTVEMLNTDAEGRLVLADCLTYVQKTYKPRFVVNLATLTGAMKVALGSAYCGAFVNDDPLWRNLDAAGTKTGERLWRMPLDDDYRRDMDSDIADIRSIGKTAGSAGSCTAAAFLESFIDKGRPWAHLDIAGVAWTRSDLPVCPKNATGFGVRLLDRMVADCYEG